MTDDQSLINPLESPCTSSLLQLWLLRLLVPLGGHREFIEQHGVSDDALAETVGLSKYVKADCGDFDRNKVRAELRKLHRAGERTLRNAKVSPCLAGNVACLLDLVGLSDTDCRILEFVVSIHVERQLEDTADLLGQLSSSKVFHALAVLLDLPEREIRSALSMGGVLARSGLVSVNRERTSSLHSKLDLLSGSFADYVSSTVADPVTLLRGTVSPCSPAQLHLDDYDHIAPSISILRPYLKHAIDSGRKGVNIFLYGAPGTGKSELARVLAENLGYELFEVASEDTDGDAVSGERRLRAFRAAQSFFAQRQAMIVFDEVEDVFNDGSILIGRKSTAQRCKAWINRVLEENPVPTLWLSNSIGGLDPAFIRRFDMVFELPVPPQAQRERIFKTLCSDVLNDTRIKRLAECKSLAPAVVARAASVVRSIHAELGDAGATSAIELLIKNTLTAQGHKEIRIDNSNLPQDLYDPAFIQADADLAKMTTGLIQSRSGRLCLYGPPGTGKTAYGRWLAEQMGVTLLVRKASDLMSKWVGENEKNIADAFKQAEQDGAILLIDEVDSFLQDRRSAGATWEVTLVNEMLTQMEEFSGVFIASTNLMDGLDQAALRRFDLKVKFDFLKPEQAWELTQRYCTKLDIAPPESAQKTRLARLHNLTPGNFAAVLRQNRFRPIVSPAFFVDALEAECAIKQSANTTIGFT